MSAVRAVTSGGRMRSSLWTVVPLLALLANSISGPVAVPVAQVSSVQTSVSTTGAGPWRADPAPPPGGGGNDADPVPKPGPSKDSSSNSSSNNSGPGPTEAAHANPSAPAENSGNNSADTPKPAPRQPSPPTAPAQGTEPTAAARPAPPPAASAQSPLTPAPRTPPVPGVPQAATPAGTTPTDADGRPILPGLTSALRPQNGQPNSTSPELPQDGLPHPESLAPFAPAAVAGTKPLTPDADSARILRGFQQSRPGDLRGQAPDFATTPVTPEQLSGLVSQEAGDPRKFANALHELAGPNPNVTSSPLLLSAGDNAYGQANLYQVKGVDGTNYLMDSDGAHYTSFDDYLRNNPLPDGVSVTRPADLGDPTGSGDMLLTSLAHPTGFWETTRDTGKWLTGAGARLLHEGLTGPSDQGDLKVLKTIGGVGLTFVGSLVTGVYTGQDLISRYQHGQGMGLDDPRARADYIDVANGASNVAAIFTGGAVAAGKAGLTRVLGATATGLAVPGVTDQGVKLSNNWDKLTPSQRIGESAGLGASVGLLAAPLAGSKLLPKGALGARSPVLEQLDSRLSQGAGVGVDELGLPPAQRQALPDLLKDNPGYTYWEYQGKGFVRRTPEGPDLVTVGRPPDSNMKADSGAGRGGAGTWNPLASGPTQIAAPGKPVPGYSPGTANSVFTPNRLQHGTRHLTEHQILGNFSKKDSPAIIEQKLTPILETPEAVFDAKSGPDPVKGFLGTIDGKHEPSWFSKRGRTKGSSLQLSFRIRAS